MSKKDKRTTWARKKAVIKSSFGYQAKPRNTQPGNNKAGDRPFMTIDFSNGFFIGFGMTDAEIDELQKDQL